MNKPLRSRMTLRLHLLKTTKTSLQLYESMKQIQNFKKISEKRLTNKKNIINIKLILKKENELCEQNHATLKKLSA